MGQFLQNLAVMESFILFFEKCRLCLNQPGVSNIFEKEEFPHDIFLCTGVKVHPSDNLPQKICDKCQKTVQNAKELRILAGKNNTHLRSLIDSENNKEIGSQKNETDSNSSSDDDDDDDESLTHKKDKDKNQTKRTHSPDKEKIAVRKDLFGSSNVTSSTKSQRVPFGQKPYKKIRLDENTVFHECDVCFKTFDKAKKLYLHLRTHNKTIVCPLDTCSKKFASKTDLEKHFRIHTGEKPFECDLCDKSFTQNCSLKAHKDAVHKA